MVRLVVIFIAVVFLLFLSVVTAKAMAHDPNYWYRHPDGTCIYRVEMNAPRPASGFVLDTTGLCGQPNEGRPNGAGSEHDH